MISTRNDVMRRTIAPAAAAAMPSVLLATCWFLPPLPLDVPLRGVGVVTLVAAPGYALLRSIRLNPLEPETPGYAWALVVPASLAVDAVAGTFLVAFGPGLSTCSLWAALSAIVIGLLSIPALRGRWHR